MRAISCTAPGRIDLIERDIPEIKPGWVRVAISHAGICGTDYHIFSGNFPFFEHPRVLGHEVAGRVEDANGSDFAPGEPVVINPYLACGACPACREGKPNCCETLKVIGVHADGAMADYAVLPAGNLYRATGLSLRDAAMVEFLAIGAHAVRRTAPLDGKRVLVVGGGPIGIGVALFARIAGAEVGVLDASKDKVAFVESLGFAGFLPADRESARWQGARGTGFDAVFDATGSIKAMNQSLFDVRNGGDYTLVGVISGDLVFPDAEVHRRELTIRASRNATRADFEHVMNAMREGHVPTNRLETHRTRLEDVPRDLPAWAAARDGLVKAIVTING